MVSEILTDKQIGPGRWRDGFLLILTLGFLLFLAPVWGSNPGGLIF